MRKEKSLGYIGPYRMYKRVDNVACELEPISKLVEIYLVFHLPVLKKILGYPSVIISKNNISIKETQSYEKIAIEILDRRVHKLRTKKVTSVKVL